MRVQFGVQDETNEDSPTSDHVRVSEGLGVTTSTKVFLKRTERQRDQDGQFEDLRNGKPKQYGHGISIVVEH